MNVTEKQMVGKPKEVGTLNGDKVMEIELRGGLFMLVVAKSGGKTETLSLGSLSAIAHHVARKEHPEIKFTELVKHENFPPWLIGKLAEEEKAFEKTAEIRAVEKDLQGK